MAKFYHFLIVLVVCSFMVEEGHSKARKRTTSCNIPEEIRGSWRAPDFKTDKGDLQVSIDIDAASATMHQKVGEKKTEITFDCTSGSDDGYFLTKSEVPELYKLLYEEMRALYDLKKFTCFKFDKIDSFLTINMYSFTKEPSSDNPDEACSGMNKKNKFNVIGFSPADQFTKPKKHSH